MLNAVTRQIEIYQSMFGQKLTKGALTVVAIGFVVMFVGGGSRHAIGLVLKPMAETFGWERSALGGTVALFLVVTALCMYFAGHLADRVSVRAVLGGGFFVSALGIGLMALVTETWHAYLLYGVAFAAGNGVASIIPIGVMVSRQFPDKVGLANSMAISGMGLGQLVIISALTAVLIAVGWGSVFMWLGLVNLMMVPVVLWMIREEPKDPTEESGPAGDGLSIGEAMKTRHFWLLTAVYALCGFHDFFASTHLVAFALDQQIAPLFAGNLLAFMGLAGLVGVLASGAWSDRFSPVSATMICHIIRMAIFAMILVNKDPVAVAAFAMLFGFTFWITAPLAVVFVRNAFGARNLGALSGLITCVHHMCGGLGAWIGAALFDADGSYDRAFVVMLVCSVAAVLLSLGLRRGDQQA